MEHVPGFISGVAVTLFLGFLYMKITAKKKAGTSTTGGSSKGGATKKQKH